ncbi:MAG: phospholipase C/P1 nuclease family protein [Planctomycetota bacterium]
MCTLILLGPAAPALAWDEAGHSIVVDAAVDKLPADMPAFVRTDTARARLRYLASEPDRWRNLELAPMGQFNKPDHYFDIELLALYELTPAALPKYRYDFLEHIAAYKARHPDKDYGYDPAKDSERAQAWPGFAPYRICELYVQLKSSWRTLNTYQRYREAATEAEIQAGRDNTVYLMGIMSHYVADVAQPLHTTVHYDGWTGPNPHGYVTRKGYIHRLMDTDVIAQAGITAASLPDDVPPRRIDEDKLFRQVVAYIVESNALAEKVYDLEKRGAFDPGNEHFAEAVDFVKGRLATAAAMQAALWESAHRDAGIDHYREGVLKRKLEAKAPTPDKEGQPP